ncbi:formyl transferase, partial [Mortierella sp. GBAus27b]
PDRKHGIEAWTFPEDTEVDAWDFGVVVSFGWFLPNDTISRFKLAGINVHPSLLPSYRGSAPLQRAILNQDKTTGVTVQLLDPNEFDAGKILAQAEVVC